MDLLEMLSDDEVRAVVSVVQQTLMLGDGWLQRCEDGNLRSRQTTNVVISERSA